MSYLSEKYGPWALVTGASSGMGAEFARQLAGEGFNLVLVARRADRLHELASELSDHGVEIRSIPLDLTEPSFNESLTEATRDIEVGLLINNAGALVPGPFLENDLEGELAINDLNVRAPVVLAHEYGRQMAERGRGGIIFVSSLAAYQPVPFAANYSAGKAHLLHLAEALGYELRPHGVDVLAVSPGFTTTEMTADLDLDSLPIKPMDVEPVVRRALEKVGHDSSTIPGAINNVLGLASKYLFPRNINTKIWGALFGKVSHATVH